jgi:hypothetical protein
MVIKMTEEQEKERMLELAEQIHPDNPVWKGQYKVGTDEYQTMLDAHDRYLEWAEIGYMGVKTKEYQTFKESYHAYLKTEEWQRKRKICLEYYGHRCAICYNDEKIDVHHRTYENVFDERPSDLTALCRECHDTFHHQMNDWLYSETNIPY